MLYIVLGIVPWFLRKQSEPELLGKSLLDHFPEVQQDASKITWACAANSKEALTNALQGEYKT